MKYRDKILLFWVMCSLVLATTSCANTNKEKINYYSNEQSYIEIIGTINHVVFDDEQKVLYLGFSSMSQKLDDDCFKVVGDSYSIVVANKEHIEIGATATFVTAPKYYGNGYVMPIVSLSVGGYDVLRYEDGFPFLIDWLKK